MTTKPRHVLVVGAGVIGLSSAFRFARGGWRVTVFDPSPASGATWAAAGMIAPLAEIAPGERENYLLQRQAVTAWRRLDGELHDVAGQSIALHDTGTLLVGYDQGDRQLLEQFAGVVRDFGATSSWVERDTDESAFAGVTARVTRGLFLDGDAWLDPDEAVAVLRRANEAAGVTMIHSLVERADVRSGGVAVEFDGERVEGDVGLFATGATPLPEGVAKGTHDVRPVRGVTIRLQGFDRSSAPTLRAFVRGRSCYLVSRPGGYGVLGASADEQRDLVLEVGELQRLLRDALDILPVLESASVLETRQGLRPASSDLAPFAEVLAGRWLWSSGHYRHGVTLAPMIAESNLRLIEAMA